MPINREPDERHPYPRHWCAPEREQPDEDGGWTCPDDGIRWVYRQEEFGGVWEQAVENDPDEEAD